MLQDFLKHLHSPQLVRDDHVIRGVEFLSDGVVIIISPGDLRVVLLNQVNFHIGSVLNVGSAGSLSLLVPVTHSYITVTRCHEDQHHRASKTPHVSCLTIGARCMCSISSICNVCLWCWYCYDVPM